MCISLRKGRIQIMMPQADFIRMQILQKPIRTITILMQNQT